MSMRCLALFLICCFCNAQQQLPSSASTVTLKGVVKDGATQQPIEGAIVAVVGGRSGPRASTDSKGFYILKGLMPGRIFLELSKEGYAVLDPLTGPDNTMDLGSVTDVTKNFDLSAAASVAGRIIDSESEKPITNVRVMSLHEDYGMGVKRYIPVGAGSGTISNDGTFIISGLLPGEYLIEILPVVRQTANDKNASQSVKETVAYAHSYFPGVPRIEMAAPITLSAGEKRSLIVRLVKRPVRSVQGSITPPEGISGPITYIVEEEAPGFYRHVTQGTVSKPGLFKIEGLSEGEYTLLVSTEGDPERKAAFLEYPIIIGNRDIDNLQLRLEPGIALTGHLSSEKGEPDLSRDAIQVALEAFKRTRMKGEDPASVAQSGEFEFKSVFAGKYFVNLRRLPPGWAISRVIYRGTDMRDRAIAIDGNAIDASLNIFLTSRLSAVSGNLKDSAGHPKSATIALVPEDLLDDYKPSAIKTKQTDENGQFAFSDVVGGRYKVVPLYDSEGKSAHDFGLLRTKLVSAETVEVLPGQMAVVRFRDN